MKVQTKTAAALLVVFSSFVGCSRTPPATVQVDFVTKTVDGVEEVHNSASMSGKKTGSSVSGGVLNDTGMFTVTLTTISTEGVEVEVSHPDHETKTANVGFGTPKDVLFGESGVRIRADSK